jgi:hypothetical protein
LLKAVAAPGYQNYIHPKRRQFFCKRLTDSF